MTPSTPRHSVSAAAAIVDESGRFRCAAPHGTAAPTAEASDVRWLRREQISEHVDEAYAVRLRDALDDGAPAVRAHDGVEVVADDTGQPL